MTDQQTIESYDKAAGKWAQSQRGKRNVAHEFLEKPAMYDKLPDLSGKSVLCVGSGSGEECAYIKDRGAGRVVGIDISTGLIEQAKHTYPQCEFFVMDMERLNFAAGEFDFVFSSLTLHYAPDWRPVLQNIAKVLKPGGTLLFSSHHPVKWGAQSSKTAEGSAVKMGYVRKDSGEFEVFGDYLNSRKITENLRKDLKVTYYHKPLSEIFREALDSGFEIVDFLEPKPLPQAYAVKPDFAVHEKIPLFFILELRNRS